MYVNSKIKFYIYKITFNNTQITIMRIKYGPNKMILYTKQLKNIH